jgi:cation diffusion facilitator family transporter
MPRALEAKMGQTEIAVRRGIRSSLLGVAANLALSIVKCMAGVIGHSFALVADGIESLSDVVSSSIVGLGLWFAIKPPDEDHPYGHGKAEPIAAVFVSLALIGAGIAIAVESISEIRTPHKLPAPYTLIVLLGVVLLKLAMSRYVTRIGAEIESTAVKADAWHHLSDAITSGLAFIGITTALLSRNAAADDWAALCASPIIVFNGIRQLRPPIGELLDTAPPPDINDEVRRASKTVSGVAEIEKCFIRKMGFKYYVDLHVVVDGRLSVTDGHRIGHEVEAAILALQPKIAKVLVHIEPTAETRY